MALVSYPKSFGKDVSLVRGAPQTRLAWSKTRWGWQRRAPALRARRRRTGPLRRRATLAARCWQPSQRVLPVLPAGPDPAHGAAGAQLARLAGHELHTELPSGSEPRAWGVQPQGHAQAGQHLGKQREASARSRCSSENQTGLQGAAEGCSKSQQVC